MRPRGIDVADPVTGTVRQCADRCGTCIFRPGNLAGLAPGRLRQFVRDAIRDRGHIVCHSTVDTTAPAICAGYAAHPMGAARSAALCLVRAGGARLHLVDPDVLKGTGR